MTYLSQRIVQAALAVEPELPRLLGDDANDVLNGLGLIMGKYQAGELGEDESALLIKDLLGPLGSVTGWIDEHVQRDLLVSGNVSRGIPQHVPPAAAAPESAVRGIDFGDAAERSGAEAEPLANGEGETAKSYAKIACPEAVVEATEFECEIGLSPDPIPGMEEVEVRPPDWISDAYVLRIQVVLSGLELAPELRKRSGDGQDVLSRDLLISTDDPYPSFRLRLISESIGQVPYGWSAIRVVYSVEGHAIAIAQRDVLVVDHPDTAKGVQTPADRAFEGVELPAPVEQPAPDLTVTILRKAGEAETLQWTFQSRFSDVSVPDEAPEIEIGDGAREFATQLIQGIAEHEAQPDLYQQLLGQGRAIADKIPSEFWTLLTAVQKHTKESGDPVPVILLCSQEPYIPWELAATRDYIDPPFVEEAGPFLGAQARVGRWFAERRPKLKPRPPAEPGSTVSVKSFAVITGDYNAPNWAKLEAATQEAEALHEAYGTINLEADQSVVTGCLQGDPAVELIHFAIHGRYDADSVRSGLVMRDGKYIDEFTVRGSDLERHPFVFLNACQVGTGKLVLGDYAGIAAAFLEAGAAAVVAPLWSVDDDVAKTIAVGFYEHLFAGGLASEYFREQRASFSKQPAPTTATRAAYQFFGHPLLRVSREAVA